MDLKRRSFLVAAGATALTGAFSLRMGGFALAGQQEQRLVVIVLRGALDGLAAVAPHDDPDYEAARKGLALPGPGDKGGVLDLDGFFGLHPKLEALHGLYGARQLVVLQAVATPYRERSHFDGQDVLENGATSPRGASDGWLNRAIVALGGDNLGLALSQSTPLLLRGKAPVVNAAAGGRAMKVLDDQAFLDNLAELYQDDPLFSRALDEAVRTGALVEAAGMGEKPGSKQLEAAIAAGCSLLREADGPRFAVLDIGGWDTHTNQGTSDGRLAQVLAQLDRAVASLHKGLGDLWPRTAVIVASEFGRTVAMNGTKGTDHGTGSMALLLGGAVAGGRVIADWPGLGEGDLYQKRDLQPTMDLRSMLKSVLVQHLKIAPDVVERDVLPDSAEAEALQGLIA